MLKQVIFSFTRLQNLLVFSNQVQIKSNIRLVQKTATSLGNKYDKYSGTCNSKEMANELNSYFTSIGNDLVTNLMNKIMSNVLVTNIVCVLINMTIPVEEISLNLVQ